MRHELQYAEMRPASFDPTVMIGERKTEIIEADTAAEAEQAAKVFLAGRTKISLFTLRLPTLHRS